MENVKNELSLPSNQNLLKELDENPNQTQTQEINLAKAESLNTKLINLGDEYRFVHKSYRYLRKRENQVKFDYFKFRKYLKKRNLLERFDQVKEEQFSTPQELYPEDSLLTISDISSSFSYEPSSLFVSRVRIRRVKSNISKFDWDNFVLDKRRNSDSKILEERLKEKRRNNKKNEILKKKLKFLDLRERMLPQVGKKVGYQEQALLIELENKPRIRIEEIFFPKQEKRRRGMGMMVPLKTPSLN